MTGASIWDVMRMDSSDVGRKGIRDQPVSPICAVSLCTPRGGGCRDRHLQWWCVLDDLVTEPAGNQEASRSYTYLLYSYQGRGATPGGLITAAVDAYRWFSVFRRDLD